VVKSGCGWLNGSSYRECGRGVRVLGTMINIVKSSTSTQPADF
jgi:hypothetical protein